MQRSRALAPHVVAALALISSAGCGDTTEPRPAPEPAEPAIGLDAEFVRLAREVPGFGGLFLDEKGVPTVYLRDAGGQAAAATALSHRFGPTLDALGIRLDQLRVREAQYDFLQLAQWQERIADAVTGVPGIVFSDIDEGQNRLRLGVEDVAARERVEQDLARLAIPREAIIIEETAPVEASRGPELADQRPATRQQELTVLDRVRPISGGLRITVALDQNRVTQATLGFSARRPGADGLFFVTVSHATSRLGEVDGTRAWQGTGEGTAPIDPQNLLGEEVADPPFFTGPPCPRGDRCRYSDAALFQYLPQPPPFDLGLWVEFGTIMRTTDLGAAQGSLVVNAGQPRFSIIGNVVYPFQGLPLNTLGARTGWTFGPVTQTCVTFRLDTLTLLCQFVVDAGDAKGDSGGPVFFRLLEDSVLLAGLHWGGIPSKQWSIFSPLGGGVWRDLGELSTIQQPFKSIPALFNTGVDDAGNVQPPGSPALHYTLIRPPVPASVPAFVIEPLQLPDLAYVDPPPGAAWIGPGPATESAPPGEYCYRLPFDLTGLDPFTARISGTVSSDNELAVFLNGVNTGIQHPPEQFLGLREFTIEHGLGSGRFVSGSNTLDFCVTNTPLPEGLNPTALLVANLRGEAREAR